MVIEGRERRNSLLTLSNIIQTTNGPYGTISIAAINASRLKSLNETYIASK